ncbi:MAG TPA: hypothetical protein VFN10_21850 [Thermoanaerobaculia bacterium]|nr:hypothetical protein [Thermoanaerobaculia bacterium]
MDARFCSNCRAALTADATECPACGVYAGDLFDERSLRKRRAPRPAFWMALLVLTSASYAGWIYWQQHQRSAAAQAKPKAVERKNETGEVPRVRRHVIESLGVKDECLALIRVAPQTYNAANVCDGTKLGRWVIRGKNVERAH